MKINKQLAYSIIIFVILILGSASYLILRNQFKKQWRQNPEDVVMRFGDSLERNNLTNALFLVKEDKQSEVESWIQGHEETHCFNFLNSYDDDYTDIFPKSEKYIYASIHACPAHPKWYTFTIHDIVVEKQEDGWIIVNWGEIEEHVP